MGLQDRTLEEVLDEGVARLGGKSTWKLWTWAPDNEEALFFEAEAFRTFVLVRGRRGGEWGHAFVLVTGRGMWTWGEFASSSW